MKSLKTLRVLAKVGRILSKIVMICAIVSGGACLTMLILSFFGTGELLGLGGISLYGALDDATMYGAGTAVIAMMLTGMISGAAEAVLAKFAECYFAGALRAGTPFTAAGAKELQRLGILAICISAGAWIVKIILNGCITGSFTVNFEFISTDTNVLLGVMMLVISVICRYGAELSPDEEKLS